MPTKTATIGRQLGKATNATNNNLSNVKKYAGIGAVVAGAIQIEKSIVGGEKESVFSYSPCC